MSLYVKSPFQIEIHTAEGLTSTNNTTTREFDQFKLNSQFPRNNSSDSVSSNSGRPSSSSSGNNNGYVDPVQIQAISYDANQEPLPVRNGKQGKPKHNMFYGIEDIPSWYSIAFLGFQHYLLMASATLTRPLILMPAMCMLKDDPDMGNIISTFLFVSGIVTILQTTFGTRLPVVQGGSFAFVFQALAILNMDEWKCPDESDIILLPPEKRTELWQVRMREIQGAIIMASFFQIALGFCGVFGFIMHRITPITLACSVIVIGISLFDVGSDLSATSWPFAITTMIFVVIFSQYLRDFRIPIPFTRSKKRQGMLRYPMFKLFPVLLSVIFVWTLCAVLTITDVLPGNHAARTDLKIEILRQANWFRMPNPFPWGLPTFRSGAVIGFLSAVLAGIVDSLGEYQAIVRIVGVPKLPQHAVNRGVFMEGVGLLICGIFGTGNGTTSYSVNTGAISITKVGSRRVFQTAGFIMMIFSLIGKFGAFFLMLPDPIIGGIVSVNISIIISIGISNLQNVNLTSTRNMFILGFSIFFSLATSKWINQHKDVVNFGIPELDRTLQVLFRSSALLAALTCFVLDNTISGTPEERGLVKTRVVYENIEIKAEMDYQGQETEEIYDLPFGMNFLQRNKVASWFPISPTFRESNYSLCHRKSNNISMQI